MSEGTATGQDGAFRSMPSRPSRAASPAAWKMSSSGRAPKENALDGTRCEAMNARGSDAKHAVGEVLVGGPKSVSETELSESSACRSSITFTKAWTFLNWAGPERQLITVALLVIVVLLVLGPIGYLNSSRGLADRADQYRSGAHKDPDTCYTCKASGGANALQVEKAYMQEVMNGGMNGLFVMLATVLGGIGAEIPARKIVALGAATISGFAISSGFGTFVFLTVKEEFSSNQLQEEYQEVRNMPQAEREEMVCSYKKRGISEDDALTVVNLLSKYEDYWVQHMMAEELGIPMPRGEAAFPSVVTAVSTLFFGMIPLLGVVMSLVFGQTRGSRWYRPQFATMVALLLTGVVLLLMGVISSRQLGSRTPLVNGSLMLGSGVMAATLAAWISQTCVSFGAHDQDGVQSGGHALLQRTSGGTPANADDGVAKASAAARCETDEHVWPAFRQHFVRGLCFLWVTSCTMIICRCLVVRMSYDCLRVCLYGWLTCITTGLGAAPFMFTGAGVVSENMLANANAVASGMMLAASLSMLMEAHDHCGPKDWQIFMGLLVGALFIKASELIHAPEHDDGEEEGVAALHGALSNKGDFRKAFLIFTVMFCHSAAEGVAVGVAFSKNLQEQFGIYMSLLLAIHNVPEGLAVALVLVPRGVSAPLAAVIATLTSVPQPLLAVAAFLFVDTFQWMLPLGLAFAAGAMVYVCLRELLTEAAEQLGWRGALTSTGASFIVMSCVIYALQTFTDA